MSNTLELQEHLNYLKECVNLKNKLLELKQNPIFELIITKGFCIDEMQRCVGLSVSERVSEDLRKLTDQMSKAGGVLTNYLNTIYQKGIIAENSIPEVEEAIVEAENTKEEENE